ncbi:unnamed protein product, partial [Nesidiocoris tenuis]
SFAKFSVRYDRIRCLTRAFEKTPNRATVFTSAEKVPRKSLSSAPILCFRTCMAIGREKLIFAVVNFNLVIQSAYLPDPHGRSPRSKDTNRLPLRRITTPIGRSRWENGRCRKPWKCGGLDDALTPPSFLNLFSNFLNWDVQLGVIWGFEELHEAFEESRGAFEELHRAFEESRGAFEEPSVRCPAPKVPDNGRLVEDENGGEYGVGSVVQFSCEAKHSLLGEGSIVCTESGEWSQPPPTCRAHCDYPGEPANGRIVPLKFTYEPGDRLKVTCHPGFVTRLEAEPVCLQDGNWSQPVPECRNYRDV